MGKPIDAAFIDAKAKEWDAKPEMPHRFYRVYHMRNGETIRMSGSPHLTYEEAAKKLWYFHPSDEQSEEDLMRLVDYVTIEKVFLPYGYDD
ncbi:hypothetical protein P4H94_23065 [Paenibacillus macerans]|uniref:hypothetical protein n=1 Tax=Paenibacillus macerans TaxID=44252 RepID=UPI002DB73BEE|nr:hypothetical protein [Paenibacillus macerans]MEC0139737.1 hypothetical protein [Paenibacillus macerans]